MPEQLRDPTSVRREGTRRRRANRRHIWKSFDYADEPSEQNSSQASSPVAAFAGFQDSPSSRHAVHDHMTQQQDSMATPSQNIHNVQSIAARKDKTTSSASTGNGELAEAEAARLHKSILSVFGNALPSTQFINGNPGTVDGLVQFVQGDDYDVLAYQWSANRYEWLEIGKYSSISATIGGDLAYDSLKLPRSLCSAELSSLAQFRLLGKQREARVVGIELTDKHIKALLPDHKPATPIRPAQQTETAKVTPDLRSRATDVLETPGSMLTNHYGISQALDSYHAVSDHCYMSQWIQQHAGMSVISPLAWSGEAVSPVFGAAPYQYARPYHNRSTIWPLTFASASVQIPARTAEWSGCTSLTDNSQAIQPTDYVHDDLRSSQSSAATQLQAYNSLQDYEREELQRNTPQTRSLMRDAVMRMSEQALERLRGQAQLGSYSSMPMDPSSTADHATPNLNSNLWNTQLASPSDEPSYQALAAANQRLLDHNRAASRHTLPASNAQYSTPKSRRAFTQTSTAISSAPLLTSQRFGGPWFPADSSDPARQNRKGDHTDCGNREQRINAWWLSRNTFMRQQDFYDRLRATTTQKAPESRDSISTASNSAFFDLGRLMVPLVENLTSYMDGSTTHHPKQFCAWTAAPDWAIDHTASGNTSFFDKDWNPPTRIGRDLRFRAELPAVPRARFLGANPHTLASRRVLPGGVTQ